MKVFISSVRQGLETERDALPALIRALGHEPLRFEDFTAQSIPSREACLSAVQSADVYLLLLGPFYGTRFPETGHSPTQEEHNAAQAKGIPRLVFRKTGIDFEPDQAAFVKEIEEYGTGLFRKSFSDAVDLLAKVAAMLRELPEASRVLQWLPLDGPVNVEWRSDWTRARPVAQAAGAILEVHAIPLADERRSARQLRDLADQLRGRLRSLGAVPAATAIDGGCDATSAWASPVQDERLSGGWNQVRPATLLGVRMGQSGQRSVWQRLSADRLGAVLDADDLGERIAGMLRLLGGVAPSDGGPYAIGTAIEAAGMVSVGPIASLGERTSAQMSLPYGKPLRVEPDEAVTSSALAEGAQEVGAVLARSLLGLLARN